MRVQIYDMVKPKNGNKQVFRILIVGPKRVMKYWWFLLFIILASTPSVAGPDPDILQLIPQLLAETPGLESPCFEAKKGNKEWEVSFCPDNTCDIIRVPSSTPASVIGDFTLLYLYYASGYIYLKNFYLVDARPYVPAVLARYSGKCPKSPELATAACAHPACPASFLVMLTSLGENTYQVKVGEAWPKDWPDLEKFALYRAAEVTMQNGRRYFVVLKASSRVNNYTIPIPSTTTTTGTVNTIGSTAFINATSTTTGGGSANISGGWYIVEYMLIPDEDVGKHENVVDATAVINNLKYFVDSRRCR